MNVGLMIIPRFIKRLKKLTGKSPKDFLTGD